MNEIAVCYFCGMSFVDLFTPEKNTPKHKILTSSHRFRLTLTLLKPDQVIGKAVATPFPHFVVFVNVHGSSTFWISYNARWGFKTEIGVSAFNHVYVGECTKYCSKLWPFCWKSKGEDINNRYMFNNKCFARMSRRVFPPVVLPNFNTRVACRIFSKVVSTTELLTMS